MSAIRGVLPRTAAIIEKTSAAGGFGQFYLWRDGKTIAGVSLGAQGPMAKRPPLNPS